MGDLERKLQSIYKLTINVTFLSVTIMAIVLGVQCYRIYSGSQDAMTVNKPYIDESKEPDSSEYELWLKSGQRKVERLGMTMGTVLGLKMDAKPAKSPKLRYKGNRNRKSKQKK